MSQPQAAVPASDTSSPRAGYLLALLTLLNLLLVLDKIVLSILIEPIRAEFGLSDRELGALMGLVYALFMGAAGLPMGVLADRMNRRNLAAICLSAWSAMTLACAAAQNLWHLLLARVGRLVGDREGVDLIRQAQRRAPTNFWINLTLGNTLHRLGRAEEAVGFLRVAQSIRPDRGVVYHNLGHCLTAAGRPDEAVLSHRDAVRIDPHKAKFRRALDEAERKAGERP